MTSKTNTSHGTLGWLGAALAGGLSAAAFAFALAHAETILIFLIYLTAIPLFTASLGAGYKEGIAASMFGIGGTYLLNNDLTLTGLYAVFFAVPAAVLTTLALRYRTGSDGKTYWYPEGYLITVIALYPCLIFIGTLLAASGQEGGLLGLTAQIVQATAGQAIADMPPETAENARLMVEQLPRVLPALAGFCWIIVILVSLVMAQSTLKSQRWNKRDSFAWRDMVLPKTLIVAAAATGIAGALAPAPYDYMAANLCFILCLPFFFTGLAVVHTLAATQGQAQTPFLILFYILFCIPVAMPLLAVVTALAGALDQGVHFRERMKARLARTQGEK